MVRQTRFHWNFQIDQSVTVRTIVQMESTRRQNEGGGERKGYIEKNRVVESVVVLSENGLGKRACYTIGSVAM